MIAKLLRSGKRSMPACAKYSRYVFNDRVLLFLLGFVLVEYSQLLHFKESWAIIAGLLMLLSVITFGNIATYLEPTDKHYLLVKEEGDFLDHVKEGNRACFQILGLIRPWFLF